MLLPSFHTKPGLPLERVGNCIARLGRTFPADLRTFYSNSNGAEGFTRNGYLRLYPIDALATINTALRAHDFAPELLVIGSNGGGEAFALRTRDGIVKVPFIPFRTSHAEHIAPDLAALISELGGVDSSRSARLDLVDLEIHEVKPVVFGGDPIDPRNKVLLALPQYLELVVWWNHKYREVSGGS